MPVNKPFAQPHLQSPVGILLIFMSSAYKSLRGLWVIAAYAVFGKISGELTYLLVFGGVFLGLGLVIYSIFEYQRFRFHIDHEKSEFILKKGVFNTSHIIIPFDRIQQVYFKRNLLQRVINVYEVVIDTAGSTEMEVKIKALSRKNANKLQEALLQEINTAAENEERQEQPEKEFVPLQKPLWKYRLSTGTLLRLGLSANYLRGIWVLVIFAASIFQQLDMNLIDGNYTSQVEQVYDKYGNADYLMTIMLILLPALLLIGIVITTVEVFIKYFGLEVTRTKNELQLEMGLRTNTRVTLKPKRIQIFTILSNPVQRYLNLFQVQLALANSTDTREKSRIKIPGLPKEIVQKIIEFFDDVLENILQEESEVVFKPHKLLFIRQCLLGLLPLVLGLQLWYFFIDYFIWQFIIPVIVVYSLVVYIIKWYAFKAINLKFTGEFLIKNTGFWTKKTEIIPIYKLQSITIKQPFWYKKRGVFNLIFHTAAGDVAFAAVSGEVLYYVDYSIYKIETSQKPWM